MATLEILSKKIQNLKNHLAQLNEANMDEKTRLQAQLVIIEECIKVVSNEDLLLNYDFTNAIELMDNYNFSISNLAEIISDVQRALLVRKLFLTKLIY